jgi:hypothetical protein
MVENTSEQQSVAEFGFIQPKDEAPKGSTQQSTTSSRVILKTVKGLVPKEEVKKLLAETIPSDAPLIRNISTN